MEAPRDKHNNVAEYQSQSADTWKEAREEDVMKNVEGLRSFIPRAWIRRSFTAWKIAAIKNIVSRAKK